MFYLLRSASWHAHPYLSVVKISACSLEFTHGIVRNQEKVSQAYETSVRKKRLHTKRTTLPFVVGNEQRFPLLLGTNNALRIFMVLWETKSAIVIKISQRYCLFTVWNSDLSSICFYGRHFFFRATWLMTFRALALRWSDEGLTLESSAFLPFTMANLRFQLSCKH